MECARSPSPRSSSGRPSNRQHNREVSQSRSLVVSAQLNPTSFRYRPTSSTTAVSTSSTYSSSPERYQRSHRDQVSRTYSEAWKEASELTKLRTTTTPVVVHLPQTYRRQNRIDDRKSGTVFDVVRSSSVSDESRIRHTQQQSSAGRLEDFQDLKSSSTLYQHQQHPVSARLNVDHKLSGRGGMKIDNYGLNTVDSGLNTMSSGSRRSSQDLGNYIDKYQKSDHHVDRLVRTVVQYEAATGQQFPDKSLLPAGSYVKPKTTAYISALPEVVYVKTAHSLTANDGPVYANSQGQLRRLSVDRGSSATRTSAVGSLSIQLQPPATAYNYATLPGRPPRSSTYLSAPDPVATSARAASLPPPAPNATLDPLSAYRRRPSVSSVGGTYRSRAGSIQGTGYTSGLPPRASAGSSGELSMSATITARRSSFAGSRASDPAGGGLSRRSSVTSTTGYPGSRATSVERSTNGGASSTYSYPTPPSTPNMSDTRRKIRRVLYKVSGDEDYLE